MELCLRVLGLAAGKRRAWIVCTLVHTIVTITTMGAILVINIAIILVLLSL